jgi:hypothetical protein
MKNKLFRTLSIATVLAVFWVTFVSQLGVIADTSPITRGFDGKIVTKVTDPLLQVSDDNTKATITAQGINIDYVELKQDYAKALTIAEKDAKKVNPLTANLPDPTPYARTYQDKVSGKYIQEIQQLPMVNANGVKVNASWTLSGNTFTAGANQFTASVTGNTTTLTVINDQPTDIKLGATLRVSPVLYLNGKIVTPKTATPTLLSVDPVNENYTNNTLVWDYGICKRYLRLIEGSILGRWEFNSNPNSDVKIVYYQSGDFNLTLSQYATDKDTETIPKSVFDSAQYPFEVGDSQTFYPDADPETSSVDGYVGDDWGGQTWAQLIARPGTNITDNWTGLFLTYISSASTTDRWDYLMRAIILFNIADLGEAATITGVVESLYGYGKNDAPSWSPDVNIYSSNPASNTTLAAGDFDSLGSTAFCDTAITYAGFSTAGYNNFTLNASGLATVPVRGGVVKFGTRNANYDVAATSPSWASLKTSFFLAYAAEKGTDYKPKLVVTYTVPSAPTITISAATLNTGTTARLNGNITDTGGENPTVTMYWGDNDGGQTPGNWDNSSVPTSPGQPQGVAAFYKDATGLTSSTTYYFSAAGTNAYGTGWAASSLSFKSASLIAKIMGIALSSIGIIW